MLKESFDKCVDDTIRYIYVRSKADKMASLLTFKRRLTEFNFYKFLRYTLYIVVFIVVSVFVA